VAIIPNPKNRPNNPILAEIGTHQISSPIPKIKIPPAKSHPHPTSLSVAEVVIFEIPIAKKTRDKRRVSDAKLSDGFIIISKPLPNNKIPPKICNRKIVHFPLTKDWSKKTTPAINKSNPKRNVEKRATYIKETATIMPTIISNAPKRIYIPKLSCINPVC